MTEPIVQGTPQWFEQRLGKVTASRIADLMAKTRTGYAASRDSYRAQLVLERITGQAEAGYANDAMRWGNEQEAAARSLYEALRGVLVDEVALIDHPTIAMAGASPDGLVGQGLVEIKCPTSATHLEFLLSRQVPRRYLLQMQWQMACTGQQWCDFVSYDPRMPEPLQMAIVRIERNDVLIAEVEREVRQFLAEVSELVNQLAALQQDEGSDDIPFLKCL